MELTRSATWLQRLVNDSMRADPSRGPDLLAELVARAARSTGAILWGPDAAGTMSHVPPIVGLWRAGAIHSTGTERPDPVTAEALRARTLVMGADANAGGRSSMVVA